MDFVELEVHCGRASRFWGCYESKKSDGGKVTIGGGGVTDEAAKLSEGK